MYQMEQKEGTEIDIIFNYLDAITRSIMTPPGSVQRGFRNRQAGQRISCFSLMNRSVMSVQHTKFDRKYGYGGQLRSLRIITRLLGSLNNCQFFSYILLMVSIHGSCSRCPIWLNSSKNSSKININA